MEAVDQRPEIYLHLRPYVPVSQAMALPLRGETGPRGAIVAGRIIPHAPFTDADLDMAEAFAGQAAIALSSATPEPTAATRCPRGSGPHCARPARPRDSATVRRWPQLAVLPRPSTTRPLTSGAHAPSTSSTTRFGRSAPRSSRSKKNRRACSVAPPCGCRPTRSAAARPSRGATRGALDVIADEAIIADVEAVLRESLTNVAKHARATQIRVFVRADSERSALDVIDNGIGLGRGTRRSGLANLNRALSVMAAASMSATHQKGASSCNGRSRYPNHR